MTSEGVRNGAILDQRKNIKYVLKILKIYIVILGEHYCCLRIEILENADMEIIMLKKVKRTIYKK